MKTKPKPADVDKYIGAKLRELRLELGISQEKLAKMVGITFQQIQKYERGINRIAAGRLWDIACAMELPVVMFYPKKGRFSEDI